MSNDDTLISKLISETYTDNADKESPSAVSDLRIYFEKKLNEVDFLSINDYLSQHNLSMSNLVFQTATQCYRLMVNDSTLDFPSNWSVFKEIKSEDIVYVDQSLDQDYLLDIFSELNGTFFNLALVKDNSEIKLIYLPELASKDHIQWFRGFFEKKNQLDGLDEVLKEAA